ncbi:LAGLIDADG family homing endonuclease [Bacillus cereus group sp. LD113LC]|uniref:LAGLIDADG family homing endonuclease n=3 Tax=Bacteria TaxID=2 RepID=UPI0022E5F98D|nr:MULTISPECIES: LAGLIDADG family homing endonuclease [unclassified Bacillus cereus group]MDA1542434.1 LAGLIDADG family homing endonuclease [Bacillus cereus group sp. TH244-1LC]MDA1621251.1 LAGLIDADG family homing endonuclease [Bacillus cereus group sp. TH206-1LC]MDA1751905.1 LAGLIDADG family homing endonuclease [Bacillus cereus group sp. LD113LC]
MGRDNKDVVKRKVYRSKWEKGLIITERVPRNIDPFITGIIVGFTMGEGSFFVRIGQSKTYTCGYSIQPAFSITLKRSDKKILTFISKKLKCGKVKVRKNVVEYTVVNFTDIVEVIIPFFSKYPLKNVKAKDFLFFKIICYKIMNGEAKRKEGIKKILSIRKYMNDGGTKIRKYQDIYKEDDL